MNLACLHSVPSQHRGPEKKQSHTDNTGNYNHVGGTMRMVHGVRKRHVLELESNVASV